jgi:hypothetical protein
MLGQTYQFISSHWLPSITTVLSSIRKEFLGLKFAVRATERSQSLPNCSTRGLYFHHVGWALFFLRWFDIIVQRSSIEG